MSHHTEPSLRNGSTKQPCVTTGPRCMVGVSSAMPAACRYECVPQEATQNVKSNSGYGLKYRLGTHQHQGHCGRCGNRYAHQWRVKTSSQGQDSGGNDLLCGGRRAKIEHSKVSVETERLEKRGIRKEKRPKISRGAER